LGFCARATSHVQSEFGRDRGAEPWRGPSGHKCTNGPTRWRTSADRFLWPGAAGSRPPSAPTFHPGTLGTTVQGRSVYSRASAPILPGAAAAVRATQDRGSGAQPLLLDPFRLLPRCWPRWSGLRPANGAAVLAKPSRQRRRQMYVGGLKVRLVIGSFSPNRLETIRGHPATN
jgi:hypothetical protein